MLITALTGTLAAGLIWDSALDVRRTMVLLFHEQGVQIALGAESWIRNILREDGIGDSIDHLDELWASDLPGLPVESDTVQGAVTGAVEDLHGRFNVNNLIGTDGKVDPDIQRQFERLLLALDLDPKFAGLTVDWIDADDTAGIPDGAEDPIYTGLTPPYRTYNRALNNVSELASLEGMDKITLDTLLPHITALPGGTKINVNTATPVVLQSLDLDASDVETLISDREGGGFADFAKTFQALNLSKEMLDQITVTSQFFQLKAVVQIDTVRITYFSIMKREPDGGPVTTIVRSLGTL
jgi:general secretion pathway protein K